jgi:hypothetical protein
MPSSTSQGNTKYKRWYTSSGVASNYYDRNNSSKPNPIDLSAAAYKIGFLDYNPSNNNRSFRFEDGTSLAAPMVTATVGMMRKLNSNLNAKKIKDIVIASSNLREFNPGTSNTSIMGRNLQYDLLNEGYKVGIRDLNTYNALVIAQNIKNPNYVAIARVFNNDDNGYIDQSITSSSFPSYSTSNFGNDTLWAFTSSGGNYINYSNYNDFGNCTYGFQVYSNNNTDYANVGDVFGGVVGDIGFSCNQNSTNHNMYYEIN